MLRSVVGAAVAALLISSCSASSPPRVAPTAVASPVATSAVPAATVWLCRPGLANDACTGSLDTTIVAPDGSKTTRHDGPSAEPKFDCFYVYPTVSRQQGGNADLSVDPEVRAAAVAQAARFSQVCRVWAPVYRQRTLSSLGRSDPEADGVAYESLLAGWRDYFANRNSGRPFIFIGHSQGASMLIRLLRQEIDPNAVARNAMVSAILLGANVTVAAGKDVGGSFQNIRACSSSSQTGCVIAYSTFFGQPPPNTLFGRPGQGVSSLSGQTATEGVEVLCVNPAAVAGGRAPLDPYFTNPSGATPFVEYPDLYEATCRSVAGITWLQVIDVGAASDLRPRVMEVSGPTWGLHRQDVGLALGDLVRLVGRQETSYEAAHR